MLKAQVNRQDAKAAKKNMDVKEIVKDNKARFSKYRQGIVCYYVF